jgi:hypothetical protein
MRRLCGGGVDLFEGFLKREVNMLLTLPKRKQT